MRNFLYMCYRQNPSNIVDYELVKTNQQANRMILEELNMVNNDRKESMEMEIARQCAPVLAGVKPANIFLGYPLADVKGFIDHKGKNFLYQGYWKVYENVEERKKLFSVYTIVKQEIVKEIEAGKALWQAAVEVRSPYEGLFA